LKLSPAIPIGLNLDAVKPCCAIAKAGVIGNAKGDEGLAWQVLGESKQGHARRIDFEIVASNGFAVKSRLY
jgi:hypothetical protein